MGEAAIDQDDYMRSLKQARCWHPPAVPQRERVGECGDTKWYNDKVANQELKIKCLCNQWTWNGVDMRRRANLIRDFFGPAWLFHRKPSTRSPRVGTKKEDAAAAQRCPVKPEAAKVGSWQKLGCVPIVEIIWKSCNLIYFKVETFLNTRI